MGKYYKGPPKNTKIRTRMLLYVLNFYMTFQLQSNSIITNSIGSWKPAGYSRAIVIKVNIYIINWDQKRDFK